MLTKKHYIILTEVPENTSESSYCKIVSEEVFFNAYKDYDDSNDCVLRRNTTQTDQWTSTHINHVTNILSMGREYINIIDGQSFPHLINIEHIHCIGGCLYLLWHGLLVPIDNCFNMVKMSELKQRVG